MSAITDFLINSLSGALETVGESKLVDLLQQLNDKHPDQYKAALFGGYALVGALQPITKKTKTKIDDAIITALSEAINASAEANGIVLSAADEPTDSSGILGEDNPAAEK